MIKENKDKIIQEKDDIINSQKRVIDNLTNIIVSMVEDRKEFLKIFDHIDIRSLGKSKEN